MNKNIHIQSFHTYFDRLNMTSARSQSELVEDCGQAFRLEKLLNY